MDGWTGGRVRGGGAAEWRHGGVLPRVPKLTLTFLPLHHSDPATGLPLGRAILAGEAVTVLEAAFETTGHTAATTLALLARCPRAAERAAAELGAAGLLAGGGQGPRSLEWDDLARLPYLGACVKARARPGAGLFGRGGAGVGGGGGQGTTDGAAGAARPTKPLETPLIPFRNPCACCPLLPTGLCAWPRRPWPWAGERCGCRRAPCSSYLFTPPFVGRRGTGGTSSCRRVEGGKRGGRAGGGEDACCEWHNGAYTSML